MKKEREGGQTGRQAGRDRDRGRGRGRGTHTHTHPHTHAQTVGADQE